eukprot:gene10186-biopygen3275
MLLCRTSSASFEKYRKSILPKRCRTPPGRPYMDNDDETVVLDPGNFRAAGQPQGSSGKKWQRTRAGRGPDAGRTIAFKETDADRTRAWAFLPGRNGLARDASGTRPFVQNLQGGGEIHRGPMCKACKVSQSGRVRCAGLLKRGGGYPSHWPVGQMDTKYRVYLVDPPGGRGALHTCPPPRRTQRAVRVRFLRALRVPMCVGGVAVTDQPANRPTNQLTNRPTNHTNRLANGWPTNQQSGGLARAAGGPGRTACRLRSWPQQSVHCPRARESSPQHGWLGRQGQPATPLAGLAARLAAPANDNIGRTISTWPKFARHCWATSLHTREAKIISWGPLTLPVDPNLRAPRARVRVREINFGFAPHAMFCCSSAPQCCALTFCVFCVTPTQKFYLLVYVDTGKQYQWHWQKRDNAAFLDRFPLCVRHGAVLCCAALCCAALHCAALRCAAQLSSTSQIDVARVSQFRSTRGMLIAHGTSTQELRHTHPERYNLNTRVQQRRVGSRTLGGPTVQRNVTGMPITSLLPKGLSLENFPSKWRPNYREYRVASPRARAAPATACSGMCTRTSATSGQTPRKIAPGRDAAGAPPLQPPMVYVSGWVRFCCLLEITTRALKETAIIPPILVSTCSSNCLLDRGGAGSRELADLESTLCLPKASPLTNQRPPPKPVREDAENGSRGVREPRASKGVRNEERAEAQCGLHNSPSEVSYNLAAGLLLLLLLLLPPLPPPPPPLPPPL